MQEVVLQIQEEQGGARDCGLRAHAARSTIRLPSRSTRATRSGSISVVASGCSRTAGPRIVVSTRHREPVVDRGFLPGPVEPHLARTAPRVSKGSPGIGRQGGEIELRAPADRRRAQVHDLHRNAGQKAAERGLVGALESGSHDLGGERDGPVPQLRRQRHRHGVGLSDIMHVELEHGFDPLDRQPGRLHDGERRNGLGCHAGGEPGYVEAVEHQVQSLHLIMADVGNDAAERRRHAGIARHDRGSQADILDQRPGMESSAAAEGDGREPCRIVAALDRDEADGARHPGVRNADDRLGGRHRIKAERARDMELDRASCRVEVEARHGAADRPLRIDPAEHQVRIGQRRALVALGVADRPWVRAGAFRPDLKQAAGIDRRDRAAAGPDGGDLDQRGADHEAEVDGRLGGKRGFAVDHERHVEGGAAEIARSRRSGSRRRERWRPPR